MNFRAQNFATSQEGHMQSPMELLLSFLHLAVRKKALIGKCVAVCVAIAIVYIVVTPKQYLATAEMVIDPRKSDEFSTRRDSQVVNSAIDTAVVDSEGAILTSENVALSVIKKLNLVDDPTFAGQPGIVSTVTGWVSKLFGAEQPSDYKRLRWTVEDFEKRLTVKRIGVTYVFDISFLSPDPEQAAQIANAVAAAYVDDVLQAKYSTRLRAASWMQSRLKDLSQQASVAEHAVADFKKQNLIVDTGGRLLDEQQVAELQSQLSLARANKSNAKAKLDRIKEVLTSGKLDLSVADALSNVVISKLRDTYVETSKKEADLSRRLGPKHEATMRLRAEMSHVEAAMFAELKQIGEGYRSDYEIANSQEEGLTAALSKAITQSASTNNAQVRLNQLQSAADAYRALYDTFLQRLGEAVQQQSFPLTETRVVTAATRPLKKSQPKTLLVLAGAILAGGMMGIATGFIREKTDTTMRTANQVETTAEAMHISSVPLLDKRRSGDIEREVLDRPLSAFTEAIREIRVMTEMYRAEHNMQVIGFASALSGEGKSTIAISLATLMAKSRSRVCVVDCDIRNPSLSHLVSPTSNGLVEVLLNEVPLEKAIQYDQVGGFSVLPVSTTRSSDDSSDLLSSPAMKALIDHLRTQYDLVIVDLPPLLAVIDTKAAAAVFDGFVLVTEWGKTSTNTLTEALKASGRVKDRLIGVVLNKVDPRTVNRHRSNYVIAA